MPRPGYFSRVRADGAERHGVIAAEDHRPSCPASSSATRLVVDPLVHALAVRVDLLRRGLRVCRSTTPPFSITVAASFFASLFQRSDVLRDVEHGDARGVRAAGLLVEEVDLLRRLEAPPAGPFDVPPPYDVVASNGTGTITTFESSGVNGRP